MTPTEKKYTEKLEEYIKFLEYNVPDSSHEFKDFMDKYEKFISELSALKAEIDKSVMPTGQEYIKKLEGIAEKTLLWCNTAQSNDWVNELRQEISALKAETENDKPDLDSIAHLIANNANMPYCWEDIKGRLLSGISLPFSLNEDLSVNENDKPNFRTDIAEELSRDQLIDRFCELNEEYQKLREREFQRELDTIGNKLMTAEEWMKKNYFDEEDGTWMKFDDYESMEEYADYKNQFGKDKPVMTAEEILINKLKTTIYGHFNYHTIIEVAEEYHNQFK